MKVSPNFPLRIERCRENVTDGERKRSVSGSSGLEDCMDIHGNGRKLTYRYSIEGQKQNKHIGRDECRRKRMAENWK